jgi:hypothetical protein
MVRQTLLSPIFNRPKTCQRVQFPNFLWSPDLVSPQARIYPFFILLIVGTRRALLALAEQRYERLSGSTFSATEPYGIISDLISTSVSASGVLPPSSPSAKIPPETRLLRFASVSGDIACLAKKLYPPDLPCIYRS